LSSAVLRICLVSRSAGHAFRAGPAAGQRKPAATHEVVIAPLKALGANGFGRHHHPVIETVGGGGIVEFLDTHGGGSPR
jgi:hypothetical protein